MCQSIEEIARQLKNARVGGKAILDHRSSIVYARFRGRCGYCHRDLIADRFGYACAEIDHLLPAGEYPDFELKDEPLNCVLACRSCNSTKRDYDVLAEGALGEGMDPQDALENEDTRNLMIQAASTEIHDRLHNIHDPRWEEAKRIILGSP